MSRHARIEEVYSSDEASDSDPDIMDPDSLAVLEPIRRAPPSQTQQQSQSQRQQTPPLFPNLPHQSPGQIPGSLAEAPDLDSSWITLYPLYFDASATRQQGRRVSTALATANPLAKTLADAAATIALVSRSTTTTQSVLLEPGKRHPADWANPGRVRVRVRDGNGRWTCKHGIKNKRMLYRAVAEYLQKHPTTKRDPFSLPVRGLPMPEGGVVPEPAVPRGWRVNGILPLHSAALTGGGVSDNIMKDLQAAMAGGNPALAAGLGGLGGMDGGFGSGSGSGNQGRIESAKNKKKEKGKKK